MTSDQCKTVSEIYLKFIQSENIESWDELDNSLSKLEWLTSEELIIESKNLYDKHNESNVRCKLNHPKTQCMVPRIMDAVSAIIELYNDTKVLHPKNKYVLQYYLALDHTKFIVHD